jgi:hypothetical protein
MEEDSGAFKTNPRNQAHFGHFVMTRECPKCFLPDRCSRGFCVRITSVQGVTLHEPDRAGLLYSGFSLIRGGEGG